MGKRKWKSPGGTPNNQYRPFYDSWKCMIRRAGNKDGKSPTYIDVTVCERWLSYDNFFEDMVDTWEPGLCLDKDIIKPGNREYCKEYCKWVSKTENAEEVNNRFHSKSVKCIETGKIYSNSREASKSFNLSHDTVAKACRGERNTAGGYHWEYI